VGRGFAPILAATAVACAAAAPHSAAPSLGAPLFPPGALDPPAREPATASQLPFSNAGVVQGNAPVVQGNAGVVQGNAPIPRGPDLLTTCAHDADAGKALCRAMTGDDPECVKACLDAYAEAHPPRRQRPAPQAPWAPRKGGPPVPPVPPPDPYGFFLHDCILRVRDSGGSEPPVCHFDRPLDEMGFGQSHCDAKCAELSEEYRVRLPSRPDAGSDGLAPR
jgi:hypothetical protein